MRSSLRGFTLIELMVVIAILALLVALAANSYRMAQNRSIDAATRSEFAQAHRQAALFYEANGNYYQQGADNTPTDLCSPNASVNNVTGLYPFAASVARRLGLQVNFPYLLNGPAVLCDAAAQRWILVAPLKNGGYYCVDSEGTSMAGYVPTAIATTCVY